VYESECLDLGGDEIMFVAQHANCRKRCDLEDAPSPVVELQAVDRVKPALVALIESLKYDAVLEGVGHNRFGLLAGDSGLRDALDHAMDSLPLAGDCETTLVAVPGKRAKIRAMIRAIAGLHFGDAAAVPGGHVACYDPTPLWPAGRNDTKLPVGNH
jgi:hypothetical protein